MMEPEPECPQCGGAIDLLRGTWQCIGTSTEDCAWIEGADDCGETVACGGLFCLCLFLEDDDELPIGSD